MRKSRYIVNGLVIGLLFSTFSCLAARAEETTAAASQTSGAANSSGGSAAAAGVAQPSSEEVATENTAVAGASQPATEVLGEAPSLASPPSAAQVGLSKSAAASSGDQTSDKTWHYYGTAYLWVPQINGTVGLRGYDTNISVNSGQIFSNFRGGFLGVFTPTYNRFSAPVDVLWMRLRDSKPVPYVPVEGSDTDYSVRATLNMSIVTPKAAYLLVNDPKIKIYGSMGARVWHVGTTLSLVPVLDGTFPYKGVTWTDFVMGGRFNLPLGSKASVDVLGDAGEGGATLDYQVAGVLSYKVKSNLAMQAGWRYLVAHYGNNGNIFNGRIQGLVIGATYQFK